MLVNYVMVYKHLMKVDRRMRYIVKHTDSEDMKNYANETLSIIHSILIKKNHIESETVKEKSDDILDILEKMYLIGDNTSKSDSSRIYKCIEYINLIKLEC